MHRHAVVHRDIKPANALVADDGTVRLIDFGTAHVFGRDDDPADDWLQTSVGTPAFLAPEVCDSTGRAAGGQGAFAGTADAKACVLAGGRLQARFRGSAAGRWTCGRWA